MTPEEEARLDEIERQITELTSLVADLHILVHSRIDQESESSEKRREPSPNWLEW